MSRSIPAGEAPAHEDGTAFSENSRLILPLAMAPFAGLMGLTAINVCVTKVVPSLHTTVAGVQAAVSIYTLTAAAFMLVGGKLGAIIGRRRVFFIGVMLFMIGSAIGALSVSLPMFIVGWSVLQGLGLAMLVPAEYSIIAAALPAGAPRMRGYAAMASAIALGSATGPVLGGLLATVGQWTWRLVPAIVFLVYALILILMQRTETPLQERGEHRLDVIGAVLSVVGLSLVVLGLLQASDYGWIHARKNVVWFGIKVSGQGSVSPVLPMVAAGLFCLGLFVLWEWHCKRSGGEPMLDLEIFRIRPVSIGFSSTLSMSFMNGGMIFIVPLFLQVALGLNPLLSGLVVLPMTASIVVFSQLTPRLSARFSRRTLIVTGTLLFPLGILLVWLLLRVHASALMMLPGLVLAGIGYGTANAPVVNLIQSSVPEKHLDETSGANRSLFQLGTSLGTAVAGAVLLSVLISSLLSAASTDKAITQNVPPRLSQAFKNGLEENAQTLSDAQLNRVYEKFATEETEKGLMPGTIAKRVNAEVEVLNEEAQEKGMLRAILVVAVLGFMGFMASLFLPRETATAGGEPST